MTERLYYHDPTLLEFEGTIRATRQDDSGWQIELDRSAFYPTSGGQLYDTGTLGGIPVLRVTEGSDGEVIHQCERSPGEIGERVAGRVDARRRRDNRQKHTAQHILSHAFIKTSEAETVSVHLGEEYGAVELDQSELDPDAIRRAELLANDIVRAAVPIEILFVTAEEAARLPLRKQPQRTGEIRIIKIGTYDYSACGGTHCLNSGEVGIVKIIGNELMRSHRLVKFLAGEQAFDDYRERFDVTTDLAATFSSSHRELSQQVSKLRDQLKATRTTLQSAYESLLPVWAGMLATQVERVGDHALVVAQSPVDEPKLAGTLALSVVEKTGGCALLVLGEKLVLAVSAQSGLDAGSICRQIGERTGLRGGGSKVSAQMGGVTPDKVDAITRTVHAILST